MRLVGELEAKRYKLTVMMDVPPSAFRSEESEWIYITKRNANGSIERQSIGIGASDLPALIQILSRADSNHKGKRKEFREKSHEY